ncbi:MAG: peptide/nickel transport system ATP-binding protein [Gammaproteobacteria bacterium]|jgi:peptide/nickel transport system ATP-binding protein
MNELNANPPTNDEAVLSVRDLRTMFPSEEGLITTVDEVSLDVRAGETLAVVGESGSGKTMTFLSVLRLVPPPGRVMGGTVLFNGVNLSTSSEHAMREIRGAGIAMVFQDPLTALNPVFTIGDQMLEVIRAHTNMNRRQARERAIEVLERVHIPAPAQRINDYPHQLSGGMRQRVLIAMAIVLRPKVLIADEPTTALDVTVQAQILELLAELRSELGMGMVLITHDLGLVAKYADRVAVMYAGRVIETSAIAQGFSASRHPYTRSLYRSIPRLDVPADQALTAIEGQPPDLSKLPQGCAFEPRCFLGRGRDDCRAERPVLAPTSSDDHLSACPHWRMLPDSEANA